MTFGRFLPVLALRTCRPTMQPSTPRYGGCGRDKQTLGWFLSHLLVDEPSFAILACCP